MKKLFFICLITFLLISCSSDEPTVEGFSFDVGVSIKVTNSNNEDLLDPNTQNSYNKDEIKIFNKVDGKLVEVYDGFKNAPRNFIIEKEQNGNQYLITVFLNNDKDEKFPETYIQWNKDNTDIIKAEFSRTKNSVAKKTVWLNGKEISNVTPYFIISK